MSLSGWLLLLVVVAVIGVVLFRRRTGVARRPSPVGRPTLPGSDDLTTLGLSEVRARSLDDEPAAVPTSRPARSDFDDVGVSAPRPASPTSRPVPQSEPPRPEPTLRREEPGARPRAAAEASPFVREGTRLWAAGDRAAPLLLASLAEHVGGPAAVLRLDDADRAYVVEAFAGKGPVPEAPEAADLPLHRAPQDRVVTFLDALHLDGLDAFGPHGAYVRALAEPPAGRVLLVVGLPEAEPTEDATVQIGRYADLLAELTALPETEAPADAAPVPRAAIIGDEQAAAAEAGRALAFALVTLAEAEDLLTRGTPEDVAAAEAALRDRLGGAPDVRRVEPFGDLLFGVFLDLDREGTAAWCNALASDTPPLFIGAVAPAEGDPQAIREAATDALRDAYDQQRTQVVEV